LHANGELALQWVSENKLMVVVGVVLIIVAFVVAYYVQRAYVASQRPRTSHSQQHGGRNDVDDDDDDVATDFDVDSDYDYDYDDDDGGGDGAMFSASKASTPIPETTPGQQSGGVIGNRMPPTATTTRHAPSPSHDVAMASSAQRIMAPPLQSGGGGGGGGGGGVDSVTSALGPRPTSTTQMSRRGTESIRSIASMAPVAAGGGGGGGGGQDAGVTRNTSPATGGPVTTATGSFSALLRGTWRGDRRTGEHVLLDVDPSKPRRVKIEWYTSAGDGAPSYAGYVEQRWESLPAFVNDAPVSVMYDRDSDTIKVDAAFLPHPSVFRRSNGGGGGGAATA